MTAGEQVRHWRIQRGLTQAELAAAARTQQASISRIEKGTDVPTLPLLERIASAMGCSVNITFTDDRDGRPGAEQPLGRVPGTEREPLKHLDANRH